MEFHHHHHHHIIRAQPEDEAAAVLPQFYHGFTSTPMSTPEREFMTPPTPPLGPSTSPINFLPNTPPLEADGLHVGGGGAGEFPRKSTSSTMEAMRDIIYRMAATQPMIPIDPAAVRPPERKNVRISKDPQSVAARQRRKRISEKMRILQRLVPGGTKLDTASMLDEAVHYVKFLKKEVESLGQLASLSGNRIVPPSLGGDGSGVYGIVGGSDGGCVSNQSRV
ncbi:hypothetical protein Dimus_017157 [Dionaea muscipula]